MLVNFALDILGTSVSCDKVSTDGHECTNLIHSDYRTKRNGYLAEHFVRPPVHVTFSFPCNVNISHVVLEPYVGQQQSMQLELLCAHKAPPRTQHGKAQHKANVLNSCNSSSESSLPAFYAVSKITSSTRSPVCLYNPRFNSRSSPSRKNFSDYRIKSEMRHSRSELLTGASHIMVKIIRTLNSSIPALNGVEIWGCVSSSVCDEVRQVVEGKYHRFVTPEVPLNSPLVTWTGDKSDTCGKSKSESNGTVNNSCQASDSFEIPEEFFDPLTWEVMTIPMLLPSGKNIDKSSLDRFSDSEASHGRQPRDPFTGVEFSVSIKPIPNVDLKARIDSFLLSNLNEKSISTLPRTLGVAKTSSLLGKRRRNDADSANVLVSSLVRASYAQPATKHRKCFTGDKKRNESTEKTLQGNFLSTVYDNSNRSNNRGGSSSSSNRNDVSIGDSKNYSSNNVKKSTHGIPSNVTSIVKGCYSVDSKSASSNVKKGTNEMPSNMTSNSVDQESHDARLKASLDSALFSVLATATRSSSISNYNLGRSRDRDECSTRDPNACVWCGPGNGHKEALMYVTPCHHPICRHCLLSLSSAHDNDSDISCKKCGKSFKKKDVVRAH